jgi:flagellum-specific ATP synthase
MKPSSLQEASSEPQSLGLASLDAYRTALRATELTRRLGWVKQVQGLAIDAQGPYATLGELCRILPPKADRSVPWDNDSRGVLAEIVGLRTGHVTLMPYGSLQGICPDAEVVALGHQSTLGVGPELIGRVIDGFGEPLDEGALKNVPCTGQLSIRCVVRESTVSWRLVFDASTLC